MYLACMPKLSRGLWCRISFSTLESFWMFYVFLFVCFGGDVEDGAQPLFILPTTEREGILRCTFVHGRREGRDTTKKSLRW